MNLEANMEANSVIMMENEGKKSKLCQVIREFGKEKRNIKHNSDGHTS